MSGEKLPQQQDPLSSLVKELLTPGIDREGWTRVNYGIRGELSDLHIALGQAFPDLFPQSHEPLPYELEHADEYGTTPISFEGLPIGARIKVEFSDYRPRIDYDNYEIFIILNYKDKSQGTDWHMAIGKNQADGRISRAIRIPARASTGSEGELGSDAIVFCERPEAEQDFAAIVHSFVGELR